MPRPSKAKQALRANAQRGLEAIEKHRAEIQQQKEAANEDQDFPDLSDFLDSQQVADWAQALEEETRQIVAGNPDKSGARFRTHYHGGCAFSFFLSTGTKLDNVTND